jgi:hypothetical protein
MRRKRILLGAAGACLAILGGALAQQQQGGRGGQGQQGQGGQQQQKQAQTPGAVSGQVVSATTSEPLRKVTLVLQPQGGRGGTRASATSDNGGMFRFNNVEPGTYTLSGERTGYVEGVYGEDQPGAEARRIEVTAGQTATGILLKLIPHSVVVGRVFDEDGDPVQGAQVQILRYTYGRSGRQLQPVQAGSTNDLGEYRIAGLPPGRYYASANYRGRGGFNGRGGGKGKDKGGFFGFPGDNQDAASEGYITTYYPRTASPGSATPLELVAGSELRGIDIGLLKERLYEVSGVVEGIVVQNLADTLGPLVQQLEALQGQLKGLKGRGGDAAKLKAKDLENAVNVQVNLQPRDQNAGGRGGLGGRVNQQGVFTIQNVPPGSYYLTAQSRALGNQPPMTARMPVDVTSGHVQNLRLRLQPAVNVTGVIQPERPDSNLNLKQVRINFQPTLPGGPGGGRGQIQIDDKGAFQTLLPAETYTVEVQGAPQGYYLKSVKLASQEAPDNTVNLNFSGGPLELVLGADAGNVTGRVQKGNDPAANVRVTAVPASGSARRDLYKAANSADDGSFTLSNLPPGDYKLFAWEEIDGNAWMDAEFRRPFESLAQTVQVRGTLTPTVSLRVIGREQLAAAGVR